MNIRDFRTCLDLYSADMSRWPPDLVKPALALAGTDARARALMEEALALDAALRACDPAPPDTAALEGKIAAAARARAPSPPPAAPRMARPFGLAPHAAGGGLLAAALLGFVVGILPPARTEPLLDPVFYTHSQIIAGEEPVFNAEEIFE